MMVMPLIDFYTSGLDWIVKGVRLPTGMFLFLALTFTNGCIIEIGRKIRVPEDEEPGVETYSALWGRFRAAAVWIVIKAGIEMLASPVGELLGARVPVARSALVDAFISPVRCPGGCVFVRTQDWTSY